LITLGHCVHRTLHDDSHFKIPSKDGTPKDKEKVFQKSDMFSIPSTMKSGKNINLQNQSQVENEGGCMRPYEFTHATFLSLLGKNFVLKHWLFQGPLNPKNPT